MPSSPASRASVASRSTCVGGAIQRRLSVKIACVEAGEHGDADDLGVRGRGGLGGGHHRAAAGGVDGHHRGRERGERLDRLGDGVGDVVELQIEEDRQAERRDLAHAVGPVGGEEFEAQLDPADVARERLRQRLVRASRSGVSIAT